MSWYRHKVERDLARWQESGWVGEAGAAAIKADLASRKSPFGVASIFAILGAVLFGFAIMSFVAAHWTGMSKLARLALLLITLWGCYGAAAALFQRQLGLFAHAALLAGIAVYGASIMLIAQMYHMEGNPPDAVLWWALGALLAATLAQCNPALAATFVLLCVWTAMERGLSNSPHWTFVPVWALAAGTAAWMGWRPGLHLAALSLTAWIVPLGYLVLDHHAHWLVVLIGVAAAGIAAAAPQAIDRHVPASAALFTYGVAIAFAGLFVLQFVDDGRWLSGAREELSMQRMLLLAAITLVGLLGAMLWALTIDNRAALWLAYGGFALEIFMLYAKTFGSLLNTSLFFLVAAIIVSALAFAAFRLHQRKSLAGDAT